MPYRKCRNKRKKGNGWIPPSTKARWDNHLRLLDILRRISPIKEVVIEDISAVTKKGQKKWNQSFSPLEIGKKYFDYELIRRDLNFQKFKGYDTAARRKHRGFSKTKDKKSKAWNAHCVDSHCLIEIATGKTIKPNPRVCVLEWLRWNRRELHQGYKKGHIRRNYGSTRSLYFNRGSLVRHTSRGLTYIGGHPHNDRVSLHSIKTGKRLCHNAKPCDLFLLTNFKFKVSQ